MRSTSTRSFGWIAAAMILSLPAAARPPKDCNKHCKVDVPECTKTCKQYAGKGGSHCEGGCKKMQEECIKRCKEKEQAKKK